MPKNRLTRIYTRTGDKGTTSLDGKKRIPKNSLAITVIGGIDELNSAIGLVVAYLQTTQSASHHEIVTVLTDIQHHLFDVGGDLCIADRRMISADHILFLEKTIDHWNSFLPPLKEFILPRGSISAASCHLARAICRRVECTLVALAQSEKIHPEMMSYINRLSDLLFVAARIIDKNTSKEPILWKN